ncbi:hypothetical protein FJT64_024763 [Amphibalanus amphitrite]|uniref:Uncharacterized protein n=1 Tax=Amphibalanus amphitrite TaxID=1232801 RepID=A0A6A4WKT6_AMPAM|nr:hypothetical protein FJT64_024763 [Amphibalanus amphitrite]
MCVPLVSCIRRLHLSPFYLLFSVFQAAYHRCGGQRLRSLHMLPGRHRPRVCRAARHQR